MIQRFLGWLAEICDITGELCDNLSTYPGLGFLAPFGEFVGSFADKHAAYKEKLELQKQQLRWSKEKAQELAGEVVGERDEKKEDGSGESPADQGQPGAEAVGSPGRSAPSAVETRSRRQPAPAFQGTVMLDAASAEADTRDGSGRAARNADPSSRGRDGRHGPPYFSGTLAGPIEPLSSPGRETLGKASPPAFPESPPTVRDTTRDRVAASNYPPDYLADTAVPQSEDRSAWREPPLSPEPQRSPEPLGRAEPELPQPELPEPLASRQEPGWPEPAMPQQLPAPQGVRDDSPAAWERPVAVDSRGPANEPRGELERRQPERGLAARPQAAAVPRPVPSPPVEDVSAAWGTESAGALLIDEDQPPVIPVAERDEELARLEYLAHLLRDAREPLCGANGALVLIPLATVRAGPRENVELPLAIRADLETVQDQLGMRFPATAFVVGLEDDRGFEELVRRIGPQRAATQRFGHRFEVRSDAVPGQISTLCARIVGVFEDWVYAIFRERGSIARPGNSHLFGLLCQVRTELQPRLMRILAGGFGRDPQSSDDGRQVAFNGCYFAATGRTEDRRAFVRGVFEKLVEEQNQVEWTSRTQANNRRYRRLGWLGLCVALGAVAWLVWEWF